MGASGVRGRFALQFYREPIELLHFPIHWSRGGARHVQDRMAHVSSDPPVHGLAGQRRSSGRRWRGR